jgi:hypothetical protein
MERGVQGMIDMTNNRVPYGLLTDEEKAALHEHWRNDGKFEYTYGEKWNEVEAPSWGFASVYRTVPLPKTQDVIAWDRLPAWVQWVARDEDGEVCAYDEAPQCYVNDWMFDGSECTRIDYWPEIVQIGTCDWRDSKQRRPK